MTPAATGGLAGALRECLETTLAYAVAEVPFYAERLGPVAARRSLTLADFPLVDRAVVDEHLPRMLVARRFPDYVVLSGGTSGQPPGLSFRIDEEYEAAHEFLTGHPAGEAPALEDVDHFVLDVFLNTNGHSRRKSRGWPLVSVALERRVHAELVRKLLAEGLDLGRGAIRAGRLQAQNGPLRTLTGYFAVTDFDPAGCGLDTVVVYGGHVSRAWRARIEAFWGARLATMYGLSEFGIGNAVACGTCGSYHYLTAWPEFLSLDERVPVEQGDALLALTSLVPFVVVQPRIRYLTGDIVTATGRCPGTGLPGFRFRGRAASSVWERRDGHGEVLLSETDVLEVVEDLPDVRTRRHTADLQLWEVGDLPRPPFRIGFPLFALHGGGRLEAGGQVRVDVEVTFDPEREAGRAGALRARLVEGLHAEAPRLRERVAAGDVALHARLLAPGGLGETAKGSA